MANKSLVSSLVDAQNAELTRLRAENEALREVWGWLAANPSLEIAHSRWQDDEDCWQVHTVSGNKNDQEWTLRGSGATPLEAVQAARQLLGETK